MQIRVMGRALLAAAFGLGCLAVSARSGSAQPKAAQPKAAQPKAAQPKATTPDAGLTPEAAAHRAEVVAQFEGTQITIGQLEDAIRDQNPFMQQRYLAPEAIRAMLDRSLRFELLAAEARRRGYDKNEAVTLAVKQNEVQALIKQQFDDKFTEASIPPEDVKKYYDEHIAEFVRPESRRASLLIVASEADAKALLPKAKAADLRAFRELARTQSVDPTNKQRGGDLGYFDASGHLIDESGPVDSVDAALAKATFALKTVGDTSGVVKVAERFAIVRLAGLRPAQSDTPASANERIRVRLWRERRQAAIDAKLAALRTEVKPEVHPELVDAVKLELAPVLPPGKGMPAGFPQTRTGPVMRAPGE
jgi:peptidyl-prolyl cis-trans isomerase C